MIAHVTRVMSVVAVRTMAQSEKTGSETEQQRSFAEPILAVRTVAESGVSDCVVQEPATESQSTHAHYTRTF